MISTLCFDAGEKPPIKRCRIVTQTLGNAYALAGLASTQSSIMKAALSADARQG